MENVSQKIVSLLTLNKEATSLDVGSLMEETLGCYSSSHFWQSAWQTLLKAINCSSITSHIPSQALLREIWFAHLFCPELNMHDRNKEQYLLSIILDLGGFFFGGGLGSYEYN